MLLLLFRFFKMQIPKLSVLTWIIIVLMVVLFVPAIFAKGMFLDGLTYATLARNWVEGRGTFWFLYYTNDLLADFHSHPPFGMIGLAVGYWIFGDTTYVEICYSILTGILVAWGIYKIGKLYHPLLGNVAIILWLFIPLISWAYRSNILENTLSVYTTWAVYCLLVYFQSPRKLYLVLLSGILLCLGFLTKGPTALFPFCLPVLYGLVITEKKERDYLYLKFQISINSIHFFAFIMSFLLVFNSSDDARRSILLYLDNAIHNAQNHTVQRHTFIIEHLLLQMAPLLGIMGIILGITYYQKKKDMYEGHPFTKWSLFFILLGCSGVFPIALSNKQSGYYMLAALPFFALGVAAIILPFIEKRMAVWEEKGQTYIKYAAISLIIATMIISIVGKDFFGRDKEMLEDLEKVAQIVPPHSNIYVLPSEEQNWLLYAYFARFGDRSIVPHTTPVADFYLLKAGENMPYADFETLPVKLHYGTLWKRKDIK